MAKKDFLRRAAGVLGMEEEKKENQIEQQGTEIQEKTKGQTEEKSETKTEEKTETPAVDSKEPKSKEQPKEEKKDADSAITQTDQKSAEAEPKDEMKDKSEKTDGEDSKVEEAPKRGRKKSDQPVKDRVIVMIPRDPMITLIDSFSVSRSATARAILTGSMKFIESLDRESSEEEIVQAIEKKLS